MCCDPKGACLDHSETLLKRGDAMQCLGHSTQRADVMYQRRIIPVMTKKYDIKEIFKNKMCRRKIMLEHELNRVG